MHAWFHRQWQSYGLAHLVLMPLSWLYGVMSWMRRWCYRLGWLKRHRLPVPVIVVGNIHVGGTGKTPLVIYLVNALKQAGYCPGVISRGYGGTQRGEVTATSNPYDCGDEPLVIARQTDCPVWVNPDRVAAGQALLKAHPMCNVIVSDDGLQHLRLQRDVELVMLDSSQTHLNQLLPAGPLRENKWRLLTVDAVIDSGLHPRNPILNGLSTSKNQPALFSMLLHPTKILSLDGQREISVATLKQAKLLAFAGIGNPQKFFNTLTQLGLQFTQRVFDDHHHYTMQDFATLSDYTLLMTEKDAVKCQLLALPNAYYLAVQAEIKPLQGQAGSDDTLATLVTQRLASL
jgi:tetraacyldisaccharide 4'-kinase